MFIAALGGIGIIIPILMVRKLSTKRLNHLFKIAQLVSGKARIQIQAISRFWADNRHTVFIESLYRNV